MPNDIFVAAADILQRIDHTTLSMSLDDYEVARRSYEALCNGTAKPERSRRERKLTLAGALKQASKAGVKVRGATVATDGSVSLTFGEAVSGNGASANPWDEVLN
jgi:hypothetical protein